MRLQPNQTVLTRNHMARLFCFVVLWVSVRPLTSSAYTKSDSLKVKNLITLGHSYGMIRHFYPSRSLANFQHWECLLAQATKEILTVENEVQALEIIHKRLSTYCPEFYIKRGETVFLNPAVVAKDYDSVLVKENYGWGDRNENRTGVDFLYRSSLRSFHKSALPSFYPGVNYTFRKTISRDITIGIPLSMPIYHPKSTTKALHHKLDSLSCLSQYSNIQIQIGTILEFCTVMEHYYPYLEELNIDSDSIKLAFLLRVIGDGVDKTTFFSLLEELCAQYKDGHCAVMPYTNFDMWPDYVPNIRLTSTKGKTLVSYVGDETGSITIGDEVIKINNIGIQDFLNDKINRTSGATYRWRNFVAHKELLAGEQGTQLSITTKDESGHVSEFALKRTLKLYKVERSLNQNVYSSLGNGNHYINLATVSDSILAGFIEDSLSVTKGLILDVRGYPRAQSSKRLLGFLSNDTLYSQPWYVQNFIFPYQDSSNKMVDSLSKWVIKPEKPRFLGKVVFLVDAQVISGTETYMSIVDHYNLGTIVGQPTAGTNGNVNSFQAYGQYYFWFTGMTVLKYDRSPFHGIGIAPYESINIKPADIRKGVDPGLARAKELLNKE